MTIKKIYRIFLIGLILPAMAGMWGCKKEEPLLDVTPKITLEKVSPLEVVEFKDSILISFKYEDGDGDIGYESPDSLSLSIQDVRLSSADWYHISLMAPPGEEIAIKGSLSVKVKNTFLLGNGGTETTTYNIQLRDRAGHQSNTITTPSITIKGEN